MAQFQAPRLLAAAGVFFFIGLAAAAQDARRYDGRTLNEFRQIIQELDFKSPDRARSVPGLRAIINDAEVPWFTRRQAALTLGRIGEPARDAVADLIKLLHAPIEPVETGPPLWSLKALALFGPLAADAAPDAIRFLTDRGAPIILRLVSTETLARIGVESSAGLTALIKGAEGQLETDNRTDELDLRIACIEALQLPAPPSAVPMLIAACADPAERIRHAAAATLGYLGARAEPAADVLGSLVVHDETPVVRETAARSLARLGDPGVTILQRLLQNDDPEVLIYALDAAGRTMNRRRDLEPALKPLLKSRDNLVAVRTMNAWWLVTRDAVPVLNPLIQFIESDDREVRKVASDTLMLMGAAALPARKPLERIAAEGSNEARVAARRVLRALPVHSD
jgi:HEAT repeat protein